MAGRHLDDAPGGAHGVVLLDERGLAQEHGADLVLVEVERHAEDGLRRRSPTNSSSSPAMAPLQAVDVRDTVADLR